MGKMKDSGIEWIGEIPDDWKEIPNRYLFIDHSKKVGDKADEFQLLSLTTSGVKIKDLTAIGGKVPESYENYQTVEKGDMVFCLFDLDCSAVFAGLSNYNGMITSAYDVLKPNSKYLFDLFVDYYFQYVFSNRYYKMYSKNIRYTITTDMFRSLLSLVPPIDVQYKIGNKLLKQNTKIDRLIINQQAQIEKLKEYKQSVITEAVTKGLDPSVPMKPSGVEWIGEVPINFSIQNIRSLFQIRKEVIGREPETVLSITQSGLKIKNVSENEGQMANSYANYQIVHIGDFAMNHMDLLTGGIGISKYEGVTSPDYRVFEIKKVSYIKKYFLYVFETYYRNKIFYAFGQGAANLGRWRLPAQNFYSIFIPVPSVKDQQQIADHLDKKCAEIDKLISVKQQKIEKLNEYKKSLIYEYVTGKKQVW